MILVYWEYLVSIGDPGSVNNFHKTLEFIIKSKLKSLARPSSELLLTTLLMITCTVKHQTLSFHNCVFLKGDDFR